MPNTINLRRRTHPVGDLVTVDYSQVAVQSNSPGLLLNIVVPRGGKPHWGSFRHWGQPVSALQSAFGNLQPDEPGNHTVILVAFENGRLVLVSGQPIEVVT